jgi:hypothetical protein
MNTSHNKSNDNHSNIDLNSYSTENCILANSLLKEVDIVDRIPFKDKNPSKNSYNYIYQSTTARQTNILKRILKLIYNRQVQIIQLHGMEIHPNYFITIDRLYEMIKDDSSLSESERSTESISSALKQMVNMYDNGMNKTGYIYPFIIPDNNKYSAKFCLISPQLEKETPIYKYRKACFLYSLDAIQNLLNYKLSSSNDPNFYQTLLFDYSQNREGVFVPGKGSLEYQLHSLFSKAMSPFDYIPQIDFIQDFQEYCFLKNKTVELMLDYHIVLDDLDIKGDGSYNHEPELFFQLRTQYYSLEYFLLNHLNQEAEKMGFQIFSRMIVERKETIQNTDYPLPDEASIERLIELAYSFPFATANNPKINSYKEAIDTSVRLLKSISREMKSFDYRKDKSIIQTHVTEIENKIKEHTQSKKTLLALDMQEYLSMTGIKDVKLLFKIEQAIVSRIHKDYGYIETNTQEGKNFLYTVDPTLVTAVVHNLQILSSTNVSYKKQYDYSRLIEDKLKLSNHPKINSGISPTELLEFQEEIQRLEYEFLLKKRKEDFRKKYNLGAAGFTLVSSLLLSIILFFAVGSIFFLLLGLPIAFLLATIASILFSEDFRRTKRKVKKSQEDTPSESMLSILNAAESKIFGKEFNSIEEKFFDKKSLRETIVANLHEIQSASSFLQKERNEDKVISTIENAVLFYSAIIYIPKDILLNNKPDCIIVNKSDLRSPLFRSQLAEFFKYRLAMSRSEPLSRYYKFIINAVEVDYARYLHKKG